MKIAPSLGNPPPDHRTTARGGGGASFAQLLESGTQARTLLSHRALGFSEAGLFGVHFAHGQDPSPRPTASARENTSDAAELPQSDPVAPFAQQAAMPSTEARGAVLTQQSRPVTGPVPGPATPEHEPASAAFSDCSATADASEQPLPEEPHLAPVRPRTPAPSGRRSPFRVRLLGDGAELVVVLEGHRCGDESILELEATARAVASEYCMAISHVFVKPNGNGAAA